MIVVISFFFLLNYHCQNLVNGSIGKNCLFSSLPLSRLLRYSPYFVGIFPLLLLLLLWMVYCTSTIEISFLLLLLLLSLFSFFLFYCCDQNIWTFVITVANFFLSFLIRFFFLSFTRH